MDDIKEKVKLFLENYNLLKPENVILIAFSGGYDSLCLLNAVQNVHPNIIAIHLNHNWRGAESQSDEQNCEKYCITQGIKFYSEKLSMDIPKTETAAREARYKFFEKCAEKFNSQIVLTAHNANDNAETLIYRVAKGTGIAGLAGIAQSRGIFYRPLLSTKREDIETYCNANGLKPNIDASNADLKYKRNFVRHEILTRLEKINPSAIEAINSLSEIAQNEDKIINEYLQTIKNPFVTKTFIKLSHAVQSRFIYNLFIENNLDYDREKIMRALDFILENSSSKSGKKCSLTSNLWLFVNESMIEIVEQNEVFEIDKKIIGTGEVDCGDYIFSIEKCFNAPEKFPVDSEMCAFVDLNSYKELAIRHRKEGDRICPLNSCGGQKLKKFLNEKKIPAHKKDELIFLASKSEILWVPGFGVSDKIKVVNKPTHVLRLMKK